MERARDQKGTRNHEGVEERYYSKIKFIYLYHDFPSIIFKVHIMDVFL